MCVCVRACVRACVRVCVCVCVFHPHLRLGLSSISYVVSRIVLFITCLL